MSEYQSYEFIAVDRPLTSKQMAELRAVSTRAEISPTRFWNEYQWGDLKADPARLVERYFDAHLYFANWGSRRLMLRVPLARVDVNALRACFVGDAATARRAGEHMILDLHAAEEDVDEYEDSEGSLAALAPLRAELMRGDLRVAYLAWLLAVQSGDVREKTVEPEVPPGLSELTGPQQAMVEVLRIDVDLISAAADGSDQTSDDCTAPRARARRGRRGPRKPRERGASRRWRSASTRRGRSSRSSSRRVRMKRPSSWRPTCASSRGATERRSPSTCASRRCGSANSDVVDSSTGGSTRRSRGDREQAR